MYLNLGRCCAIILLVEHIPLYGMDFQETIL
jgi:hypothetical protein